MELDYKQFGHQIRNCRKAKHLSQEQLAEMCEMSVSHLQYIETGERRGSMDVIFAISCALEVPIDTFMLGQGKNFALQYSTAFYEMFKDCSKFESQLIYDLAIATKESFNNNSRLLYDNRRNKNF